MPGWPPRCELVVFPAASLPRSIENADPAVLEALTRDGVPKARFYAVPSFVNSSLAKFSATARAVVVRYPYYALSSSVEEVLAATAEVAAIVAAIDAPALGTDLYWATFVDDMRAGAFASEVLTGD